MSAKSVSVSKSSNTKSEVKSVSVSKDSKAKSEAKSKAKSDSSKEVEQPVDEAILDKLCELSGGSIERVLKEFVQFMYDNTRCVGGLSKGILYKELPNSWSDREVFTDEEKKYECTGEAFDDCTIESKINKFEGNDIPLIWEFKSVKQNGTVNLDVKRDEFKLMKKSAMLGYMKTLNKRKDEVFFNGTIKIDSKARETEDHRGSNHCLIMLPFETDVELKNPTFSEFIEALYLSRYNKFNGWYELYAGAEVKFSASKKSIIIKTSFDYGS